jgi:predicted outer membrane repeat protein
MRRLVAVFAVLWVAGVCGGAVIRVEADGSGDYPTIQAAINAAVNGDEIVLGDGTYRGTGNRDMDFKGKAVTVQSEKGAEGCVIDCQNAGRGFVFHSGESSGSILEGVTITRGSAESGAGVHCSASSPLIRRCTLAENKATRKGGGIYIQSGGAPQLVECVFYGNRAEGETGGAVNSLQSSPTFHRCSFDHNYSKGRGGAISSSWGTQIVSNCLFTSNNGVGGGGAMENSSNAVTIDNCVFYGNRTYGTIYNSAANTQICNSIFWANSGGYVDQIKGDVALVRYSCIQGWDISNGGTGNVGDDPMFVNVIADDYRLIPGSPCADAGDPAYVGGPGETLNWTRHSLI